MRPAKSLLGIVALALVLPLAACVPAATPTAVPTKPAAAPTTAPAKPAATAPAAASPAASPATKPAASPSAAPKANVQPLNPPVHVKFGSIGTLGGISYYLADLKGYYKDEGLDVEFVSFKTGGEMIPALSNGDIDAGSGAINAGLFNAIARDISMELVGESSNTERTEALAVRSDLVDSIKDFKDLKGRKIAISSTASGSEITLEGAMKKGGLTLQDADVQVLGFPDMLVAMANKSIEVAHVTEPTLTQGEQQGLFKRWKLTADITPGHQTGAIMYSAKFAKENNEAAKRLMVAMIRAARDYYQFVQSGTGKDEVFAAASKYTTVKDTNLYTKMTWPGIDPDLRMRADSIAGDIVWYNEKGYAKTNLTADKVIDNSFVDYAIQRLGPAKR